MNGREALLLAAMTHRHVPVEARGWELSCAYCGGPWPCDARKLLVALRRALSREPDPVELTYGD